MASTRAVLTICSLAVFIHSISVVVAATNPCSSLDAVLLFDTSQSITSKQFRAMLKYANELTTHFTITAQDTQFAGVVFNEDVMHTWKLSKYGSSASLSDHITHLPYIVGITNFEHAFKSAETLLNGKGARHNSCKAVILFTDGWLNEGELPTALATQLTAKPMLAQVIAIAVNGIRGMQFGYNVKTLQQLTGDAQLVFDMETTKVKMVAEAMKIGTPSA